MSDKKVFYLEVQFRPRGCWSRLRKPHGDMASLRRVAGSWIRMGRPVRAVETSETIIDVGL